MLLMSYFKSGELNDLYQIVCWPFFLYFFIPYYSMMKFFVLDGWPS